MVAGILTEGSMEFGWTEEEERFRKEIRDFLTAELPADWIERNSDVEGEEDDRDDFERAFAKRLGEKGWLGVGWPKEYGGRGWTPLQQLIFNEELALAKAPRSFMGPGVYQVGASIIIHGTEEQKKRFLPPIARGEVRWSTLFSEPNAGSDLGSLTTRAEDCGDYFLVNGQKIWNSQAHKSEHGILLARTDPQAPKHTGISYFLIDMNFPGIKVVPIVNMADVHHFDTVFFDNVRVPRDRMVGEKNRGWYIATTSLNVERSGIRLHVPAVQLYEELVDFVRTHQNGYKPMVENPQLRYKLADMAVQLETSKLLSYLGAWMQSRGKVPDYQPSVSKLYASEMTQRLCELGMEVLGQYSQLAPGSKRALLHGKIQKLYRAQRAITIGAGTSEVQRTVIARRGLGLSG